METSDDQFAHWDETILLDEAHLQGFTLGDRDLEREILAIFLEKMPQYIAVLAGAAVSDWESSAHKISGSARGIGAWHLAVHASSSESMVPVPPLLSAKRAEVIEEMQRRLEATKQAIDSFLLR